MMVLFNVGSMKQPPPPPHSQVSFRTLILNRSKWAPHLVHWPKSDFPTDNGSKCYDVKQNIRNKWRYDRCLL